MTSEAESANADDAIDGSCVLDLVTWSLGTEPPLAASRLQQLDSLRLQQQVRRSAAGGGCGAVPGCHTATIASGCPTQSLLCTYVSPFDVSLQESVTSELNYLVARGRQACPMVCAPPPTLSVTHAFPHLALSAPPAAYLHGFSTLTLISCHPAVQGAAERRLSRGKGAPDHVRGGSACRRLIRMAPES